jgi:anti-sigma factor RsiW
MDHKEAVELLAAYLDDEVTLEQRREIDAHVAQCRVCQKELDVLKRAQDSLRRAFKSNVAGVEPPPQAWQRLEPGLESYRPSLLFLFRRRKWRIVATIVLAVILVALAVLWGTGVLPGLR